MLGLVLELLLQAGSLRCERGDLRLQPVETVVAGDCQQLLSVGVRTAVLSHPAIHLLLYQRMSRLHSF